MSFVSLLFWHYLICFGIKRWKTGTPFTDLVQRLSQLRIVQKPGTELAGSLTDSPCLWYCPTQQWSGFQSQSLADWGELRPTGEHTETGRPDSSEHQQTHSNHSDILHWNRRRRNFNPIILDGSLFDFPNAILGTQCYMVDRCCALIKCHILDPLCDFVGLLNVLDELCADVMI